MAFMTRIWHLAIQILTKQYCHETKMVATVFYVFIFLLTLLSYIFMKKNNRKPGKGPKLPPGSMGWPYIGETLQLYSQDPNSFFAAKQKRSLCLSSLSNYSKQGLFFFFILQLVHEIECVGVFFPYFFQVRRNFQDPYSWLPVYYAG